MVIPMLETCPLCGQKLIIGTDSKQYIKYDPEYRAKFDAGEITLEELSEHITVFYDRTRLCANAGNENTYTDEEGKVHLMNPPCGNFYGRNGHTIGDPFIIVEKVTIEDN
jgi:hypothetical protein